MAGNSKLPSKSHPTWTDVKAKLADFDRAGLLDLIRSLYSAHKGNQVFLHSRFGLGGDVLEPYKKIIDRWLWPDVLRNQDTSVSQAKQAISDYKKAVGDTEGVAELMVFYCEQAAGFCSDIYSDDEGYFDALVRMFEAALKFASATTKESCCLRPNCIAGCFWRWPTSSVVRSGKPTSTGSRPGGKSIGC